MAKRLISVSPDGLKTFHDYDPSTRKAYRLYEQDAEASLDYSKSLQNDEERAKRGIKQDFQHVAHYPPIVVMKMMTEHGVNPITQPKEALAIAKVHFPDCLCVRLAAVEKKATQKIIIAK